MKTKQELIEIGRNFLNSLHNDLKTMHGLDPGVDLSNETICYDAGLNVIKDQERMIKLNKEYEIQQKEMLANMTPEERNLYDAQLKLDQQWGNFRG